MAITGYQDFMLPLMRIARDGQQHSVNEAMATLSAQMKMSDQERDLLLPSGKQTQFYNRVTWALTYLSKSLWRRSSFGD